MAAATANTNNRQRRPTFLLVVLSVAVVLWLLGLFALMLIQVNELNRLLKEKVDIIVEVQDSLSVATVENRRSAWPTAICKRSICGVY